MKDVYNKEKESADWYEPAEIIIYDEKGIPSSRNIYNYDLQGNLLTRIYQRWENDNWVRELISKYIYDSKGVLLEELEENSNTCFFSRVTYTYNAQIITKLYESWDDGDWKPICRETYTFGFAYDLRLLTKLSENWIDDNWVFDRCFTYTYDSQGNILTCLDGRMEYGKASFSRSTYTYDLQGNMLTCLDECWENGTWESSVCVINNYDAKGNIIILLYFAFDTDDYESRYYDITYDSNGNILTELEEHNDGYREFMYTYDEYNNAISAEYDSAEGIIVNAIFPLYYNNMRSKQSLIVYQGFKITARYVKIENKSHDKQKQSENEIMGIYLKRNFANAESYINSIFRGVIKDQIKTEIKMKDVYNKEKESADCYKPKEIIMYDEKGELYARTTCSYDSHGNKLTELEQIRKKNRWKNDCYSTYTYDSKGNMLTRLYETWKGGSRNPSSRYTYSNDSEGNTLTKLHETCENNIWNNKWHYIYTYDSQGKMLTYLCLSWKDGIWENYSYYTYNYDLYGNKLTELHQIWRDDNWVNDFREQYTYDSQGNTLTECYACWQDDNWINKLRQQYTYDSQGNMLTSLAEFWENGSWNNSCKSTYNYDLHGNRLSFFVQTWDDDQWNNACRFVYTYDLQDNILTHIRYTWDDDEWNILDNLKWDYDDHNNAIAMYNLEGDFGHFYYNNMEEYKHCGGRKALIKYIAIR